jgi:hypothetical protein
MFGSAKGIRTQIDKIKVGVEDIDSAVRAVIGSEKKGAPSVRADGKTGVNRASR